MGSHVHGTPGSRGSSGSGGEGDEIGDYSMATYIRQNSENFQRLHSVTESVCLTEEQRRLIDQELCQASSQPADQPTTTTSTTTTAPCTCSGTEYCSSDCKDADKYKQLKPTHADTATPVRGPSHVKFFRSKSHTCTGAFACKCPRHKVENKRVKEFKVDIIPISSSETSIDSGKPGTWCTVLKWTGAILAAIVITAALTVVVCSVVLTTTGAGSRLGRPVNYSENTGEAKPKTAQPLHTYEAHDTLVTDSHFHRGREEYVSFYLDPSRFFKGGRFLRWTPDETSYSREFTLTENDCIRLGRTAHYQLYSKITFEIFPTNRTNSAYQTVQLVRNGEPHILDKDIVYIPPPSLRRRRVLKSSLVMVLQRFEAGDVICVRAKDTALVYDSKIDSSLKIIRKL